MGAEARTRLALSALLFATAICFEQVFAQSGYFAPALLGMGLAMGIAVGLRRLGISALLTWLACASGLVWYLVLVFEPRHSFYGFPTVEALRQIIAAIQNGYAHSLVDYAPVPLRPGYAVLAIAGTWLIAANGEIATFRWRRPLVATLPAIGLFGVIAVVGTGALSPFFVTVFLGSLLAYLALESAHRLQGWGRWVGAWKSSEEASSTAITGSLARRMGVACVVAALAVPIFLPALQEGLLAWRKGAGGGSGSGPVFGTSGPGAAIDPLVSVVPQLINQTDRELFRVEIEAGAEELDQLGPVYWHLQTLSFFDGDRWLPEGGTNTIVGPDGAIPSALAVSGRPLQQRFQITNLGGTALPQAGVPGSVTTNEPNVDVRTNPATGDLELGRPLNSGLSYTLQAQVPDATFKELNQSSAESPEEVYRDLPPGIATSIYRLAERWTRGAETDFQKLIAIQDHLRSPNFTYDTRIESSASSDYLAHFLLESRRGYCQQYATAFAVLARTLGLPSRVVVGFLPGETSIEAPNRFTVRGTHTHAWPEVYFPSTGWVQFEPTPRNIAVPPAYTTPRLQAAPDVRFGGGQAFVGNPSGRLNIPENQPQSAATPRGRLGLGGRGAIDGPLNFAWQKAFARVAAVLGLATLAFLLLVPALKKLRIERRYARARDARGRAGAAFGEFQLEAAELAGSPRSPAESASAYVKRIAAARGLPQHQAARLAEIYEAAQYAPADITSGQSAEARRLTRELRRRMWQQASGWEKASRLFGPAGLARSA